uniref:Uncharacterized protein n=1 Tax=Octopus bimaculoides TaxID=37653 RepID=A0A0L8H801_OCTBM
MRQEDRDFHFIHIHSNSKSGAKYCFYLHPVFIVAHMHIQTYIACICKCVCGC